MQKWESGQIYPDISNLIQISDLMSVSIDYLVKDQDCAMSINPQPGTDLEELIAFRLEANVNTYAAFMNEVHATRPASHDFDMRMESIFITIHMSEEKNLQARKRYGRTDMPSMP